MESNFINRFLNFKTLPPPHFKKIGFFKLSSYFLFVELGLTKNWNFFLRKVLFKIKPLRVHHPSPLVQEGLKIWALKIYIIEEIGG